jgi:hypothetical protein
VLAGATRTVRLPVDRSRLLEGSASLASSWTLLEASYSVTPGELELLAAGGESRVSVEPLPGWRLVHRLGAEERALVRRFLRQAQERGVPQGSPAHRLRDLRGSG